MMRMLSLSTMLVAVSWLGPVSAHPHVFVDAGVTLIRDTEGRVVEVDVTWRYDELYSLLILEDYGLDPDYDLVLTDAEIDTTLGFDLNWSGGFAGGLVLYQGGVVLGLGVPSPVSLDLLPSGQLQTTHRRPVTGAPLAGGVVEASVFDPEFYVAFEMILPSTVRDAPACQIDLLRPDLDTAYERLEEELQLIGGAISAEDNFPAVGHLFADKVLVTCPE